MQDGQHRTADGRNSLVTAVHERTKRLARELGEVGPSPWGLEWSLEMEQNFGRVLLRVRTTYFSLPRPAPVTSEACWFLGHGRVGKGPARGTGGGMFVGSQSWFLFPDARSAEQVSLPFPFSRLQQRGPRRWGDSLHPAANGLFPFICVDRPHPLCRRTNPERGGCETFWKT